jgi:FkbM family methyltransferase
MKKLLKRILNSTGYEIRRTNNLESVKIGTDKRPVGSFKFLLEDLRNRGLNCKTILDVGANQGSWSRMAKEIYPEAKFCLIEPQIEMKEHLETFCRTFENSSYFLAGAGAQKDTLTLTIWDDLAGSSFLPKPNENLKGKGKQREIEIITIDDLVGSSKIEMPELIKLDIQGFELEALKGAEKTFGNTEVYILEVSLFPFGDVPGIPIFSDVINFMLEREYVAYDFPGFLRRPLDGALGQCDICFVKKNGFLRASNDWI